MDLSGSPYRVVCDAALNNNKNMVLSIFSIKLTNKNNNKNFPKKNSPFLAVVFVVVVVVSFYLIKCVQNILIISSLPCVCVFEDAIN